MTQEEHIKVEKHFRYYTYGDIERAEHLIIALHGYGQLAQFFIRKFNSLPEKYFIVCPEGMHRFYLNGTSGRVGASWMTKEDRLIDIEDNHRWLSQLYIQILFKKIFKSTIILGFSQGGATAARWFDYLKTFPFISDTTEISLTSKIFEEQKISLILWASVFPPDLKIEKNNFNENSNNYFIVGDDDEYFQAEDLTNTLETYQSMGYVIKKYQGGHSIDSVFLNKTLENIAFNNQIG